MRRVWRFTLVEVPAVIGVLLPVRAIRYDDDPLTHERMANRQDTSVTGGEGE